MNGIDRINIGHAKVVGMEEDLGMVGNAAAYSICLLVFFPAYMV